MFFLSYLADLSSSKNVGVYFSESPQLIFGDHLVSLASSDEANSVLQDIRSKLNQLSYQSSEMVETSIRVRMDDYFFGHAFT